MDSLFSQKKMVSFIIARDTRENCRNLYLFKQNSTYLSYFFKYFTYTYPWCINVLMTSRMTQSCCLNVFLQIEHRKFSRMEYMNTHTLCFSYFRMLPPLLLSKYVCSRYSQISCVHSYKMCSSSGAMEKVSEKTLFANETSPLELPLYLVIGILANSDRHCSSQ